jgi:ubiquinone/menaquinone biosynthesis C-methylase UbiE
LQSKLGFEMMAFSYKFRDLFQPRRNILSEIGIEEGVQILDYGCGPGGYIPDLAEMTGDAGRVYALDIHPRAIELVENIIAKQHLTNVKTIRSDCKTGLKDNSIDIALLNDILHDLSKPEDVLQEIHRVLKPKGVLSVTDHHLKSDQIKAMVTSNSSFKLFKKGEKTHCFQK